MKTYAVVGLYEDNGQVFRFDKDASDPYAAMQMVAVDLCAEYQGENAIIVGAIEPTPSAAIKFIRPADDNYASVYAVDLMEVAF